jgi:adenylate cyclase
MVPGRAVALLIANPQMPARVTDATSWPSVTNGKALVTYRMAVWLAFGAALALIFTPMAWRHYELSMRAKVAITFAGGPAVRSPRAPTLREISRMPGVPHAFVCGGRARCSTCRVRINTGADSLPLRRGSSS